MKHRLYINKTGFPFVGSGSGSLRQEPSESLIEPQLPPYVVYDIINEPTSEFEAVQILYRNSTISDTDYISQFRNGGLLNWHRAFVAPTKFATRRDNLGNAVSSRFVAGKWRTDGALYGGLRAATGIYELDRATIGDGWKNLRDNAGGPALH